MTSYLRRPGRWLRRTRWMAGQITADLGLRGAALGRPAWLRDNLFLVKTSRTEVRRFSVGSRLLITVLVLSGLLLGGLWLHRAYPGPLNVIPFYLFGVPFPAALLIVISFVHALLITNARTALTVSLGDEARRGTLPDLLLTPLRRAEMLLAMGIGPARTAFLVALAGLPIYLLLAEFGGLSAPELALLYVLFALLSYAPPTYALPASGSAPLPITPTPSLWTRRRRAAGGGPLSGQWLWPVLSVLFVSQALAAFGGGWLGHLLGTLGITLGPLGRPMLFVAWPYLLLQLLGRPLDWFHLPLPPLLYVLPLAALNWAAGALSSAAALSAGDAAEMKSLPLHSRAQTLTRWVMRLAALAALGVVWKPWVESGDTALLAGGSPSIAGCNAAGLALLLGALSLPAVSTRALAAAKQPPRPPLPALRQAARHALRPLGVAGAFFLLGCALGGVSPFEPPVYQMAGKIALAGLSTALWAVGIARILPIKNTLTTRLLLYALPVAALALPLPLLWNLAALSPVAAWVRLFPEGPALIQRFPLWSLGFLPSFPLCVAASGLTGLLLMAFGGQKEPTPATLIKPRASQTGEEPTPARASPPLPQREGQEKSQIPASLSPPVLHWQTRRAGGVPEARNERRGRWVSLGNTTRNTALTAVLMAWVTARTDNPLFTYEMRTRTRSGRWADWRYFLPLGLLAALILTAAYPDFADMLSALSPFRFFGNFLSQPNGTVAYARSGLASLLLLVQVYVFGLRGQTVGEALIARDRQRGTWGFILLTPLTMRQIFWGKVFGQTVGFAAAWAALGVCILILYGLAAPTVGLLPALLAWLIGQVFAAALFLLGVSLGVSLATLPIVLKSLRGATTLLLVGLIGGGLWLDFHVWPWDTPGSWQLMTLRLLLGSVYALVLAAPLFAFAQWRMEALRKKDVAFGDGAE